MNLMSNHFKAFDKLRKSIPFIGEFIWNFADFQTPQSIVHTKHQSKIISTFISYSKNKTNIGLYLTPNRHKYEKYEK